MKKETVQISVIIPVYNRKKILLNCLKSVINQSRYDLVKDIIVIDDHSNFIVRKYVENNLPLKLRNKIKYLRNSINRGPAYSRNVGKKLAKGNFISYLDSDDEWYPNFIEEFLKCFNLNKHQVYMSFTLPKFLDVKQNLTIARHLLLSFYRIFITAFHWIFNDGLLPIEYFYITRLSSIIFKKNMISKVKFDDKYKSAEDWKYVYECLKISKSDILIVPRFLSSYLVHNQSETLGRSGYFNYYRDLIRELSAKDQNKFGIRLFKLYANSSI